MKNYKKLFCMILCVIAVLGMFAGCNQQAAAEPTDAAETIAPTVATEPVAETEAIAEYIITYEVNGGELPENAPLAYTEAAPVMLPAPGKEGYAFGGWYEEEDFSGMPVLTTEGETGDKIYYAMWIDDAEELPEETKPEVTEPEAAKHVHAYTSVVVKPTTSSKGYTLHTCACGASYKDHYTDKLPEESKPDDAKPEDPEHVHSYTSVVTKPTCTAKGYTTHTCECGDSYTSDETAATGHDYKSQVVSPTTSAKGYTLHTCKVCGDSYKDNYTDKLPQETKPDDTKPENPEHVHSYTSVVTKPTCTTKGYTTHTCACGDSYTSDETPASHDYESEVIPPTASRRGYTLHTCKNCGDSYKDNYVDKLPETEPEDPYDPPEIEGHTHTWGEWLDHEDGWKYRICPECGEMDIKW